jgi:hypothetical protein
MKTIPIKGELTIRDDGKVIWVNTELGCLLRICGVTMTSADLKKIEEHPKASFSIDITVLQGVTTVALSETSSPVFPVF